ncbi:NHLP family bacteriocin export ABC transporter peptidase/permease/ATPase subunit [Pontibacter sp. G13]|uniref:NHLP family bacteriocin export ABC transporter peptidase/permease/ATPase subunit n=1 Tax=Pontibacter sp. G13 TaxID=3074898 RepID=UPI00288B0255|nr:NHLP family bacteriocin export ABC transporter peptidase/permease/ATPase subunit [Pontibacter sp. G13]WNJ16375.1 NHLP family bacteriocin export ABC transporter peptidase/permease/ATPase subunit [Pontibacter sp. G13]
MLNFIRHRLFSSNKVAVTPTVLQMESVECGAASLSIILGYYGRFVPLEKLRVECGVSRDGLKATNIMKAARSYGLKAKGYSKSIEKLKATKTPAIIFWNFNHFVVLEGFGKQKVYINDPAQGRYQVTYDEFEGSFTGVVMTFEPTADFEKGNEKGRLRDALSSRISNSKLSVVFIVLISLFLVIPGLVIPSFSQIFIDRYLVNQVSEFVMPLLLAMSGLLLIHALLVHIQQYYLLRLETKLALSTSSQFLWHVLHLPMAFFTQRYSGDITNRVGLNDKVAGLLSGDLANAALNVIVVVFYLFLMFTYDVTLTLIAAGIAALNVIILQAVARARKDGARRLQNESGKLVGTTMSGISMIETLKASGRENDFFSNWSGYLAKVMNNQQELGNVTMKLNVVPPLLMSISNTVILGLGAMQVMDGHMSLGMLVGFIYLTHSFIRPVNQLVSVAGKLQETEGDMGRIDDVLKYEQDPVFSQQQHISTISDSDAFIPSKLAGSLEIRNLTFGYSHAMPAILNDFNLKLQPGSRVALVGGSGSGKSTVARLVAGLYEPWDGDVLLDNQQRNTIPRAIVNNSVAMIDQEVVIFKGTIRDNIAFWDDTMKEHTIIEAAKDALIHDVIASRPGGYESEVVEKGTNFSGGQRQRLEIARALATNPSILIMDEGTSALDPQSEKMVMDNIRRRGCTCLIVAHRLSTIRDCDEIIVMNFGDIVERGTHEELIRNEGLYFNLISAN